MAASGIRKEEEWFQGVEIVEFAMGRDAWDLSEADSEEGEEGVIDVGASDGYEEVSLEV